MLAFVRPMPRAPAVVKPSVTADRLARLLPILVGAMTSVAFLPALEGTFLNWDDHANFLNNEAYRGLGWPHLKWMFSTTLLAVYAPLAWMTLGLNYVLGGMDPWGYHLGNLVLHAANAAVFYLVARRLLAAAFEWDPRSWRMSLAFGSAVAALAFGVHPLRVESVAWITERRDVLCGLFYLAAILAYLRGVSEGGTVRGSWRALSVASFAAALLSKGITMTLPLTLLVLDVYPLRRRHLGWWPLVREKLPYAALAAIGAWLALVAVSRGAAWTDYRTYGLDARVAMTAYSFWFYPWALVWPEGLSPLYELPPRVDALAPKFLGPTVALVAVTTGLLVLRRRFPGGLTAWIHSMILIAPVSGVVHAGRQLAHDRFSYLSGLGFALLAGAGVAWVLAAREEGRVRTWLAGVIVAGTVLALVGWGAGTWRQSKVWVDSESLWRSAVASEPSCAFCHNNLGAAIIRSGVLSPDRLREAEAHFREAIVLRPDGHDAHYNLGALLAGLRRFDEAEAVFKQLMSASPSHPEPPTRLAMVYADHGRSADAVPLLRAALRLAPGFPLARGELGRVLTALGAQWAREGRLSEAIEALREATHVQPNRAEPFRELGQALITQGRPADAVAPLRRALALDPRNAASLYWLARAYTLVGEPRRAEDALSTLRTIDPALAARAAAGR